MVNYNTERQLYARVANLVDLLYKIGFQFYYKGGNSMIRIERVDIAITTICNFTCSYCRGNPGERKRLPLDEIKHIISNFIELGARNFRLDGGEPFTYGDELFDVLEYLDERKLKCGIFTNASLINEKTIDKLKKYKDLTLFVTLHILNVANEFEKTLSGLKLLSKTDINVELILIVSKKNIPILEEKLVDIAELGFQLTLRPIIPIGKAFENMEQGFGALTELDVERIEVLLKNEKEKYPSFNVVNAISDIHKKKDGYHDKSEGFVLHVNTNSEILPSFAAGTSKYLGSALDLEQMKKKLEGETVIHFLKSADSAVLERINGTEQPTNEQIQL